MTTNTNAVLIAAQAVVDRWDTPAWKDVEHTAVFINRLRAALTTAAAVSVSAGEYPALPPWVSRYVVPENEDLTGSQFLDDLLRAYVDADRAMRAQAAPAAVAGRATGSCLQNGTASLPSPRQASDALL